MTLEEEYTAKFLAQDPTLLAQYGDYKLWEHPTRGDTDAIYMTTPTGRLVNTGFYDLGDFGDRGDPDGLALCIELDTA